MQKITPFLWFDTDAEPAANFYVSLFPDSRIVDVTRYGDAGPGPPGQVMLVSFELAGQRFTALNGGPLYRFTEAVSFVITCDTQDEIDTLWTKLLDGGQPQACGWLKDRYGLSWQVVPAILFELFKSKEPARAQRVMQAMLQMIKFDIRALQDAYDGK